MDMQTGSYDYTGNYTGYSDTRTKKQSDVTKLLLGALAGAAVGSLVAGLYTEKGIEARHQVGRRSKKIANDIKEKATDIAEGIKEKASNVAEDIKEKASNVTTPIADKYQSTKKAATKLFAKGKPKDDTSSYQSTYSDLNDEDVEISKTKVILALVGAALAGTTIWSFTTEKGKETRKRVAEGSKEVAQKLKASASNLGEELKTAYDSAKEGVEDLLEQQKQQGTYGTAYNSSTNTENTF